MRCVYRSDFTSFYARFTVCSASRPTFSSVIVLGWYLQRFEGLGKDQRHLPVRQYSEQARSHSEGQHTSFFVALYTTRFRNFLLVKPHEPTASFNEVE